MSTVSTASRIGSRVRRETEEAYRAVRAALAGQGRERDLVVQAVKAAGAAVLAWLVAGVWWGGPLALMAPWTAVVLVQSTVYRSVRAGIQQFVLIGGGTLLAALAFAVTGDTVAAMALVLPVTMLLGGHSRFDDQGVYASTTALFVLVYGSFSTADIGYRLLETLIGAVIGIAVNALVLPPVHLRHARDTLYRLPRSTARLLSDIGAEVAEEYDAAQAREWHSRAERLPRLLDEVRGARRWQREGDLLNPVRRMRRQGPRIPSSDWDTVWERLTDHLSTVTRVLADAVGDRVWLRPLPVAVRADLTELLHAMAKVCECDCVSLGGDCPAGELDRDEVLNWAWQAHGRLAEWNADHDDASTAPLGGLVRELDRLLRDLTEARPADHLPVHSLHEAPWRSWLPEAAVPVALPAEP
ncbi:aromatic acid exporter family protein [Streptomyces sp. NPDC090119]|uniref:FUSC family protein n=1 Tax=Streptomyces sp. NPDC090119 TaxID=3365951 RepID=UPI00380F70EF